MLHSFWHQVPMVKLLIPLVAGVVLAEYISSGYFWLGCLCVLLVLIVLWFCFSERFTSRWRFGCILFCAWFAFGGFRASDVLFHLPEDHFSLQPSTHLFVWVSSKPKLGRKSFKMEVTVLGCADTTGILHAASGKLMLYVPRNQQIIYGAGLLIPAQAIQRVSPPLNPHEFDYQTYLARKGIFHQAYCTKVLHQQGSFGNPLQTFALAIQQRITQILNSRIGSATETAVAQALLYGDDDGIDPEVVKAYSHTGTLHVLAVSGMHVGIIYLILGFLLRPLSKFKAGKWMQSIVLLFSLWLYALICGLSPSILRATVMFSFIVASEAIGFRSNVYNTLAASAFVLICHEPFILLNAGFQLSYLAVFGILFFHPYIDRWFAPTGWLLNEAWKIGSVSIASQLSTLPITLFYFGQFPTCFLLSNLVIIPLTSGILYGGMLLLLFNPIEWLSSLLGKALFYAIRFTNQITLFIERLPFAYIDSIHLTALEMWLLGIIIAGATVFVLKRSIRAFRVFILAVCFILCSFQLQWIQCQGRQRLIIHAAKGKTVLQYIAGTHAHILADSTVLADSGFRQFTLVNYWRKEAFDCVTTEVLPTRWTKLMMDSMVVCMSGERDFPNLPNQVDAFVLRTVVDPVKFARQAHKIRRVIAVSKTANMEAIRTVCSELEVPFTLTIEEGFYQINH